MHLAPFSPVLALAYASLLFAAAVPGALPAQAADTLRGHVTLPDSAPAVGALVDIRWPGATTSIVTTTDSAGRYMAAVEQAAHYTIVCALPGFAPVRATVTRAARGVTVAELHFTTSLASVKLEPVEVEARRRPRPRRGYDAADKGGDRARKDVKGFLAPDDAGTLSALAGRTPGVERTMGGFSVLGLPSDQNSVTLNGVPIPLDFVPPGSMDASFSTTPLDPSRGGFSGGQLSLTPANTPLIYRNTLGIRLALPALQFADPTSTRLGQEYTNIALSGVNSGPLLLGKSTYNVSYQLDRHSTDLSTLLSADPGTLGRVGVAPDSVVHFLSLLGGLGIPATTGAVPHHQISDRASVAARVESWPSVWPSLWGTRSSLMVLGTWSRTRGMGLGPTAVPAAGRGAQSWGGVLQGQRTGYLGDVLQTWTATLSGTSSRNESYVGLPAGQVNVVSDGGDFGILHFGGAPGAATNSTSWAADLRHSLSWRSMSDAHGFTTATELHFGHATSRVADELGSYAFNSLADLAARHPASYTRTMNVPPRASRVLSGAFSFHDTWRAAKRLSVQYGVRADFQRFGTRPAYNPAVDSLFGLRTDHAPGGLWLSPRLGFTWTPPAPIGSVHGSVGLFVNDLSTALLNPALDASGLPSGVQRLKCVGDAVPVPDWNTYATDRGRIPTSCADGTAAASFTDTVPHVELFAPGYRPARSWRGTLGWSRGLRKGLTGDLSLHAWAQYSRTSALPGTVDLNFARAPRFGLASESGRPVFVSPSAIVPATGAVASLQARPFGRFAQVLEHRSDLHSEAQQYSILLSGSKMGLPTAYEKPSRYWLSWTLQYLYSRVRDEGRGTGGAPTLGDPNLAIWGRSGMDVRHRLGASFTVDFTHVGSLSLYGWLRSGAPFTPLVSGDVNGDGRADDPAFIFDPAQAADSAVAADMASLLRTVPAGVRECLTRQLGRVAARNSCTGPWSTSLNASATLDLHHLLGLPQGAKALFSFQNVLPGLDRLVHGGNVHGWGLPAYPDPVLLSVTGFDPATNRFRYAVNSRFGDTRPAYMVARPPFQITASISLPLGPDLERQAFHHAVSRLTDGRWVRRSAAEIREQFVISASGLAQALVSLRDTLLLTTEQIERFKTIEREHRETMDTLWAPVAKQIAALPEASDERAAFSLMRTTQRRQRGLLIRYVLEMRSVLTARQLELLPAHVRGMLDPNAIPEVDD